MNQCSSGIYDNFSFYSTLQLGERNAVVFSLESAKMPNLNDLPDSFYELNVRDVKLLIKDLRTQMQGTSDQPPADGTIAGARREQRAHQQIESL